MKFLPRLRQIAMVGGVESFGVAVGGIAGLLIVNVLPKEQYAAYTFLIACLTLILGVTDLGLAHCCLPLVGQRAKDKPWVVGVCHQVFRKRWVLLALGFLIIGPYWFQTSGQHDWWNGGYLAATVFMVVAVLLTLREHFVGQILLILGHVPTLNRIGFSSTLVRLGFVALVLLLPVTSYSVSGILLATAAASLVSVAMYRKALRTHDVHEAELGPDDRKRVDREMYRIAKPLVLPAIFYQIQGVTTVFLVSMFGTANMLAEVGAFGRLAMVLVVADRVTNVLLFPAIARTPTGPRLARILLLAHLAYFLMMAVMLATGYFFPQYWIILLGKQYANMAPYVWMVFLASLMYNAAGFAFRSLAVRGATAGQSYSVAVTLITQVMYLWLVGVPDLKAVLGFGIATSFASFAYQYLLLGYRWLEWRHAPPSEPEAATATAPQDLAADRASAASSAPSPLLPRSKRP